MKNRLVLLPLLLFIWSCDWRPDEIQIESKATIQNINLVVGDTLSLQIDGNDFSLIDGLDETIAEVIDVVNPSSGRELEIIGKSSGDLMLFFHYKPVSDSDTEDMTASYSIHISVTESIPLFIDVGESQPLDVSNYISSEQLTAIDSIAAFSEDISLLDRIRIDPIAGELTKFILMGESPGSTGLQVNCYDANRSLIVTLFYQITVSIHKVVLGEMFTNSGCVNCPEANHYLDNIALNFSDDLALVRYHVNWTDPFDPMNLYNPGDVESRRAYYNIFAAPGLVIEGTLVNSLDEDDWSTRVYNASQATSSLYISPIDVVESTDSLFLQFDLNTFDVVLGELTVWSAVLEDSIEFAGSNGETIHMDVMRDMTFSAYNNMNGLTLIQHSLKKPDDYGITGPMNILVYVQSETDKSVIQAYKQNLY